MFKNKIAITCVLPIVASISWVSHQCWHFPLCRNLAHGECLVSTLMGDNPSSHPKLGLLVLTYLYFSSQLGPHRWDTTLPTPKDGTANPLLTFQPVKWCNVSTWMRNTQFVIISHLLFRESGKVHVHFDGRQQLRSALSLFPPFLPFICQEWDCCENFKERVIFPITLRDKP